ncbi:MAG: hypothetical protein R2873_12110 [Caldilineaceae bacterium]|nr:hypothetical protein [Caldilineaceae bacterium]
MEDDSPRAPGIHTVEPEQGSPQAQRGNLYILIELMGDSPIRSQALRLMHKRLETTYYSAAGSVSALLRGAILAGHAVLKEINERTHHTDLRAGIICAALVDGRLIMASAGPALAMVATDQRVDQFPPGPRHYTTPLGGDETPLVSVYREQIGAGDALFLGESDWILLTTVKTVAGAITTATPENRFDVLAYLRKQVNSADVLGLLVVLADETDQTAQAATQARNDLSGLPTALGAAPPVRDIPAADEVPAVWEEENTPPKTPATPSPQRQTQRQTQRQAPRKPEQARAHRFSIDEIELIEPGQEQAQRPRAQQVASTVSGALGAAGTWTRRTGSRASAWITNLLPDRTRSAPEPSDWIGAIPELGEDDEDDQAGGLVARPRYTPPERTRGSRARLFILLAILIPLLAFATVGAFYLREGASNQTEGVKLVELAESQLLRAQQALSIDDESGARAALGEAQRYLDEAIALIGINERIRAVSEEIRAELQSLLQVRSLYSLDFPLHSFPNDADPRRVVVFDQDVYVLDTGRQVVEFFRTDSSRSTVQENHGAIIREGDVVEGVTVGRLVDIAWQGRIAGFADKASLLILDRNNNIFRYNNVDEATYLRLAGAEQLGTISQIENYTGRLYLLDEQQNQIWRYVSAGLGYDEPPGPWFDAQVQANLAGVISTAIDGDIWMLNEDGVVLRYRQGGQLPFSLDNSAGLTGRMVDMTIDAGPEGNVYLADGSQDRILVFDKQGNYREQFQAAENNALRGLRGLYLDNVTGTLFILTQSSLYAHSLPR